MEESSQDPTLTATELHERIISLELENSYLKRRLAILDAKLADLGKAFKADVTTNSDHICSIYQYLADIHDQLWPLVDKVFPGGRKARQQIAAVIRNGGRSWDDKKQR